MDKFEGLDSASSEQFMELLAKDCAEMMPILDDLADTYDTDFGDPVLLGGKQPTAREVIEMEKAASKYVRASIASCKPERKVRDKSPMTEKISIRISTSILDLVKKKAARAGMGYQTFLNMVIAEAATNPT